MNAKKKSADRIPVERFTELYVAAAREKMTLTEFAESIGHKRDSVYIRIWGMKEDLKASGLTLPELAKETKGSMAERTAAALRAALGEPVKPVKPLERIARQVEREQEQNQEPWVANTNAPSGAVEAATPVEECEVAVGEPDEDAAFLESLLNS